MTAHRPSTNFVNTSGSALSSAVRLNFGVCQLGLTLNGGTNDVAKFGTITYTGLNLTIVSSLTLSFLFGSELEMPAAGI